MKLGPTHLQRQHRAFMAKALKNAPGKTPQERMKHAAEAWHRQKKHTTPLKKVKGKGILGSILKVAPTVFKAIKAGAQIGSQISKGHNDKASDILGIIGGLGIHQQRIAKRSKIAQMRYKQRIVHL